MRKNEEKKSIFDTSAINENLIKDSKVHTNLAQDFILTTEDKIRICLTKYLNKIDKRNRWFAPAGVLVTVIGTLLTTKFKDFYFSADTWTAIFFMVAILSSLYLIYCLRYALISTDMDDIINDLKKESPIKKDKDQVIQIVGKNNKYIIIEAK